MENGTTKVTRPCGATVGYMIGALVALALCVLLFMTIAEGPVTVGIVLLPVIVGLRLVLHVFRWLGHEYLPHLRRTALGAEHQSK